MAKSRRTSRKKQTRKKSKKISRKNSKIIPYRHCRRQEELSEYLTENTNQRRVKLELPEWWPAAEDKLFSQQPNIKKQCYGRKSFRCPITSYAPGVCVPAERNCYNKKMYDVYLTNPQALAIAKSIKNMSPQYGPIFKIAIERLEEGKDPLDDNELTRLLDKYYIDRTGNIAYKE